MARTIIEDAIGGGVFPAAVVEVGTLDEVLWREAFGRLTYESGSPSTLPGTLFDLASLTKVIATTTLAMRLVDGSRLRLADPVARWLPDWRGHDREHVTVRDLLAHSAGLSAWVPLYRDCSGRQEFQPAICGLPLEYQPRTQAVYSDLGFILLGFIVADAGRAPLSSQFSEIWRAIQSAPGACVTETGSRPAAAAVPCLDYAPGPSSRPAIAPTEVDAWRGRLLAGEVHDENAWALGGVAGHAGLFGNAPGVGAFARWLLRTRIDRDGGAPALVCAETALMFTTRLGDPGSSRALGWDTMLPASSCGTRMSHAAFGHTGFTGTSLWLDPGSQLYVVLLTNRVHPSHASDAIRRVRPAVHDAILDELAPA
ncbi:MAG: serine hydrolase [Acidobacteria bacterium]|nr:serine hydrolase [Acidobacteriota bacterium]